MIPSAPFFCSHSDPRCEETGAFWHELGKMLPMPEPYPLTEPMFEVDPPELARLIREWAREARAYYEHQRERGWGDRSVCIGPDGPTELPDWGLASRSQG